MRKFLWIAIIAVLIESFLFGEPLYGCTTAVVTARASATGRPFLWKQRDTGTEWNHIAHFKGERYDFTGLVNSEDTVTREVWTGVNSAGFAIMNNASYNMKPDSLMGLPELEGVVMMEALGRCATVNEFEEYIRTLPEPRCLETNFGVIDAQGGAAYFEVWDYGYVKYDANDPEVAPDGYLVRTNFSFSGLEDEGMGYVRYQNATHLFEQAYAQKKLSPEWIFEVPARSFYNAQLETDLERGKGRLRSAWAVDQDYIPRNSTAASVVVEGVCDGERTDAVTMWCLLGYPPCSYAVPVWVCAGERIPECLRTGAGNGRAPQNEMAVRMKRAIFPVTRDNGKRYMRFDRTQDAMRQLERTGRFSFQVGREVIRQIEERGYDPAVIDDCNRKLDVLFEEIDVRMAQREEQSPLWNE